MPFELPDWARAALRGVTPEEIEQVLRARRRWARPSTGAPIQVTLIAGRTTSGRPLVIATREISPFTAIVISARELTGADLAVYEEWEEGTDEPFNG
ncbi:hypothetical protein JK358_38170 [Nocardia sp. 2]|uniref:Uncharacterized protein n=1 Tax=Nocardia acididurans TaxID=2802282 RepID=A0ABS1MHV3_9NOCA|nr:hypothetical protein [Nocardia acididurans]MBL1080238.1 hypothetical protein [Nocardia acididurans]